MKTALFIFLSLACLANSSSDIAKLEQQSYDICVYGATSAGVIAAYTAKQSGKSVLLIEPGTHVGGLTSGGLGYTDIGNKYAISGLSRNFYRRIGDHYGKLEQWIFEPHVAETVFNGYLKSASIKPLLQHRLVGVQKEDGYITQITIENVASSGSQARQNIRAKMFIDCSYEGDLMARSGVSYFTGRESNSMFNETYNGVQLRDKHQFPDNIDPYKVPGKPESGLLWGISNKPLEAQGSGDKKIQAYNFRLCLTSNPANRIEITKPDGYDSSRYELLLRYLEKKPAKDLWSFLKFDLMPNNKTDINNNGPFSTDMIGMNYDYCEGDYNTRKKIQKAHEEYTRGFLYFIGHDNRMPQHLRKLMLQWGYPKDEYTKNGNWSPQMYIREARRMKGEYIMTQANCEGRERVTDTAGMAAYTMDSHNCQRIVVNGMVKNEGDVQVGGFGPYPVSYRSLIPRVTECRNLLVPVCLSATHIAYGSIRMEPVFMVLAQSAAAAASLAIDNKKSVQEIDIKELRRELNENPLANNDEPEILVDNDDSSGVTVRGKWERETKGGYGPSLFTTHDKDEAAVQFIPAIRKAGVYTIYSYFPKISGMSSKISVRIYDGKNTKTKELKSSDIQVEGQTSGEWVKLGVFTLPAGKKSYIDIFSRHADGAVIADAVLLVPASVDEKK